MGLSFDNNIGRGMQASACTSFGKAPGILRDFRRWNKGKCALECLDDFEELSAGNRASWQATPIACVKNFVMIADLYVWAATLSPQTLAVRKSNIFVFENSDGSTDSGTFIGSIPALLSAKATRRTPFPDRLMV